MIRLVRKLRAAPLVETQPRRVTVLGATGSIGRNTLSVIAESNGALSVEALTAMDNVTLLAEQARRFRPAYVAIGKEEHFAALKEALDGTGIEVGCGEAALCEAAARDAEVVISAIVGAAGLKPTLAAIGRGHTVALANKECLVVAGALIKEAVRRAGGQLLPVDSEHSAIFQVFDHAHPERVEKVTITASGGPFRTLTREQMAVVTPEQAVRHPNWAMGAKISVDSATLMNKGLELIEAYHLFPLEPAQLEVVIHPESIVHALVAYRDGSVLAQMGCPDMRTPIAYALAWPERIATSVKRLDLAAAGTLHFEAPDAVRFPALGLARAALTQGAYATIALNAANEVAVGAFLAGRMGFLAIAEMVEAVLESAEAVEIASLEDIMQADGAARRAAEAFIGAR